MGQYFKIVNLDLKQFLNPSAFGHGLKLWEFCGTWGEGSRPSKIMCALGLLLADVAPTKTESMVGTWAGCRTEIVGDEGSRHDLYERCSASEDEEYPEFEDVSQDAIQMLQTYWGPKRSEK